MTIHPDFVASMAAWSSFEISLFGRGARSRSLGEPPHNVDQLAVRIAGGIAEFGERVRIGKLAQTDKLADALPPVQLQLGRAMGKQNPPELALAEEMVEFGRRDIDQKQNQISRSGSRQSDASEKVAAMCGRNSLTGWCSISQNRMKCSRSRAMNTMAQ